MKNLGAALFFGLMTTIWVIKYISYYGWRSFPNSFEEFLLEGIGLILCILIYSMFMEKRRK